ncbi:3-keto-5-aminohexanoate cleavage protein [Streptomyces tubercidicus]|nr:3-keto-5-aminohexanoate cleavage protein [Streptomyces tubercidicus]WAU09998.1 3-keto-5-aminohexanoate cleavage protein [Streptomyces tubercidicus]
MPRSRRDAALAVLRDPTTATELAEAARAAVAAGVTDIHLHPKRPDGSDTLAPEIVAEAIEAVRETFQLPPSVSPQEHGPYLTLTSALPLYGHGPSGLTTPQSIGIKTALT